MTPFRRIGRLTRLLINLPDTLKELTMAIEQSNAAAAALETKVDALTGEIASLKNRVTAADAAKDAALAAANTAKDTATAALTAAQATIAELQAASQANAADTS